MSLRSSSAASSIKEIISLLCCLSHSRHHHHHHHHRHHHHHPHHSVIMGAEDAVSNPQFLTSSSPTNSSTSASSASTGTGKAGTTNIPTAAAAAIVEELHRHPLILKQISSSLSPIETLEGYLNEHEEGCSCEGAERLRASVSCAGSEADKAIKTVTRVDFNGRYSCGVEDAGGGGCITATNECASCVVDGGGTPTGVSGGETEKDNCGEGAMGASVMEEEYHQKYAFIVGLLRKPHVLLVKESLARETDKLCNKLSAYRLERNIVREGINKCIQKGSETSTQQSLTAQIKHLDYMCVTLERQIDVLGNVDHALPPAENIYSGEPDSLDGTSSEIMPVDEELDRRQLSDGNGLHSGMGNSHNMSNNRGSGFLHSAHSGGGGGFQLQINRSPLDALAMLHLERCAHRETRKELAQLRKKHELLRDEFDSGEGLSQSTSLLFSRINGDLDEDDLFSNEMGSGAMGEDGSDPDGVIGDNNNGNSVCSDEDGDSGRSRMAEQLVRLKEVTISQLRNRLLHLERSRMDNAPVETAREISRLHIALIQLERVRDELTLQNFTLKSKLAELSARISDSATYRLEKSIGNGGRKSGGAQAEGEHDASGGSDPEENLHLRQPPASPTENAPVSAQYSDEGVGGVDSSTVVSADDLRLRRKSTYKISHNNETNGEIKQLRSLINDLHAKELDYQRKLSALETELRNVKNEYADECTTRRESDRIIRELENQLDITQRRLEETERTFLTKEEECSAIKLDVDTLNEENRRLKDDLNMLHLKVEKEQLRSIEKLTKFEKELGSILDANRSLQEDCHRERLLRKRYYNMVEELKGKIRVFCRIRPASKSEKLNNEIVAKASDPYTISLESQKGHKEFQFDRVFTPEDTQDDVFADTQNLIQSAFDGYNVCICAYGQTGSGKTYTILGDEHRPGIAPRTFAEVFSLAEEMGQSYETSVSFYVLELYNDRLIDLLSNTSGDSDKLEIRRDRRGTVWVSGARVLPAEDSTSLEKCFRQALTARHTAATKMNDRSSRSHLIVGIIVETTSKINGTVLRGKISLVDLAGSERTGKSGVSADTLREANAINKSLSAFGDVLNALTTDQAFVPYRNNKLTLLMQDSIGGNAKTLMFVNVSPSSYNLEETLISLGYGQRLKQVTNGATRNAESREVARLKSIIHRMRRGEFPTEMEDMLT